MIFIAGVAVEKCDAIDGDAARSPLAQIERRETRGSGGRLLQFVEIERGIVAHEEFDGLQIHKLHVVALRVVADKQFRFGSLLQHHKDAAHRHQRHSVGEDIHKLHGAFEFHTALHMQIKSILGKRESRATIGFSISARRP